MKPFPMASDSSSFSFCPFLPLLTLPYTAPLETKILTWFLFFLNYRHVRLLPSWKRPTALSEWDSKVIIVIPPCLSRPCIPKLPTQYQLWDHLLDCVCLSMRPYEGDWELPGRQARVGGARWQCSGTLLYARLGNTSSHLSFRLQGIRQKCRAHARDFELCIKQIMPQHASYVNK